MHRALKFVAIAITLIALGSLLSLYTYGRFADQARGRPSKALVPDGNLTRIDQVIAPLTAAHPDESGLALVSSNIDAFAVRALSARHAGRSLDLQYYLWHDDLTGRLLAAEALAAADRGVRVRVLIDDINAHSADAAFRALDVHKNIEVRMFNPSRNRGGTLGRATEMLFRGLSLNRRMHNKAWIVDGQLAVVGGRNIGDEYFDAAQQTNFLDADVVLVGPAVAQTSAIFDEFWNSPSAIPINTLAEEAKRPLDDIRQALAAIVQGPEAQPYLDHVRKSAVVRAWVDGEAPLHWTSSARVYSDPASKAQGTGEDGWLIRAIMTTIASAKTELTIISPYFVPGEEGTRALVRAAQSGITINILTNSLASNDVMAVHSGYARYRVPLLRAGVNLYELMPFGDTNSSLLGSSGASLHTKAFVVDRRKGFVGSFNFDPRSARLNTEMGVMFKDPALAEELLAEYRLHIAADKSYQLTLDDNEVRWTDRRETPPRTWSVDPETSIWQRLVVALMSWLPIEKQL